MSTNIINVRRKRRLLRKTTECLRLIDRGNSKIHSSLEELLPMITTGELSTIYTKLLNIMQLQCSAYRVLLSEKEEK